MDTNELEVRQELTLRDEIEAFAARVAALPLACVAQRPQQRRAALQRFLAAWPYLTGEYPFHRAVHVSPVPAEPVLPARCAVVRQSTQRTPGTR